MPDSKKPFYVPIATRRNKLVLKDLVANTFVLIDVVNSELPYDRSIAKSWLEVDDDPTKHDTIWFENGPTGERVKYGSAEEVLSLLNKSETVI